MQVQMKCTGEDRGKKNKVTLMAGWPHLLKKEDEIKHKDFLCLRSHYQQQDISIEENLDRLLNADDVPEPLVVFYPSGEISEFEITLVWSDESLEDNDDIANQRYKITVDERGELLRYRIDELE